jgi:hypothetical protein
MAEKSLIPGRFRTFSLLPSIETSSEAYTASYSMGTGSSFHGSKAFDYTDSYSLNNAFYIYYVDVFKGSTETVFFEAIIMATLTPCSRVPCQNLCTVCDGQVAGIGSGI